MFDTLEDKADGQEEKKLMCSSDKDKIESFRTKLVVRVKPWRLSVFWGRVSGFGYVTAVCRNRANSCEVYNLGRKIGKLRGLMCGYVL